MCGFAGILQFDDSPVSPEVLKKMTSTLIHRGPDDEGYRMLPRLGLGHRRLSIIDLSRHGHQPMSNEDQTIWILYNGEIYNYRELNRTLAARGHRIKSHCDTETIIHCYEEYGDDCVHHLNGMFSFALWDVRRRRLFAAVDRMRIKPFYYYVHEKGMIFASELRAIQASGMHSGEVDMESVYHFLSLQAIPGPRTIYRSIRVLPGAHRMSVEEGSVHIEPYWDVRFETDTDHSEDYFICRLRDLLMESVEMRLMSDVPLGAFLSGGIDSSGIVALMAEATREPVKTFTIGYDVGREEYDETRFAELVARRFQTDHRVEILSAENILQELIHFIRFLDQPSSDAINSYFVARMASQDVKVSLCGTGGDELFAGYSTFHWVQTYMNRDRRWNRLPSGLRGALIALYRSIPAAWPGSGARSIDRFLSMTGSFVRKYATIRMDLTEPEKRKLLTMSALDPLGAVDTHDVYHRHLEALSGNTDVMDKVGYLDLKTYMSDLLLRDGDVMSMAFSLETRFPLIDHRLVEFAATIPSGLKLRNGEKKYILKRALSHWLPEEILNRKKYGFAFPLPIWLRQTCRPLVDFVLSREHVEERKWLDFAQLEYLKKSFFEGRERNYRKVWGPVILELWMRLQENDEEFFNRLRVYMNERGLPFGE